MRVPFLTIWVRDRGFGLKGDGEEVAFVGGRMEGNDFFLDMVGEIVVYFLIFPVRGFEFLLFLCFFYSVMGCGFYFISTFWNVCGFSFHFHFFSFIFEIADDDEK